jgi:hypothetical protein
METNYTKVQNYPFNEQNTKQSDIVYTEVVNYLHINSSDRNIIAYPSVNSYRLESGERFRNIKSIELVAASVANQNTVLNNPYLILKIDGLNHLDFSNKNVNSAFAILYLKYTTGAHVQPELGVLQRNVLNFRTPLASLSSINLQIVKPDGTLFSFGETSGDTSVNYSNSFTLRIITLEKSRVPLNNRAVYF